MFLCCSKNISTSPSNNNSSNEDLWVDVTHNLPINTPYYLCSVDNALYVYADYGLYRSSNNGDSWTRIGITIPDSIQVTAIIGRNGKIFAATSGRGVLKYDLQGTVWAFTGDSGLDNRTMYVHSIAVDDQYLYIGAGIDAVVFRSKDDGLSWTQCNLGLPGTTSVFYPRIYTLLKDNTRLYACPFSSGIYYSDNNGSQWENMNLGLPGDRIIGDFSVSDNYCYATVGSQISPGVYRCNKANLLWEKLPIYTNSFCFNSPHFITSQDSLVLVSKEDGVYLSTDHGYSWSLSNHQLNDSTESQLYRAVIHNNYVFIPNNYHDIWRYTLYQ